MVHMKGLSEHQLVSGKDYNLVEEALSVPHILQFVGKSFAGSGKGSVGLGMGSVALLGKGILEVVVGHMDHFLVLKIPLDCSC